MLKSFFHLSPIRLIVLSVLGFIHGPPRSDDFRHVVNLISGCALDLPKVKSLVPDLFVYIFPQVVQLLRSVSIFHLLHWKVEFLVEIVLAVVNIVFWNVALQLLTQSQSCLVGPTSGHVFWCVPSSAEHYCR